MSISIPSLPNAVEVKNDFLTVVDDTVTTQNATRGQLLEAAAGEDISLFGAGAEVSILSSGGVMISSAGNADVLLGADGSLNMASGPSPADVNITAVNGNARVKVGGGTGFAASGDGSCLIYGLARFRDLVAASTLGTVIGRIQVTDTTGAIVGYLPVYDTIT
jgi:hypothetical protein